MPVFLIARDNKILGKYKIDEEKITIGRSRKNTVAISHDSISRYHLRIEKRPEGYVLTDLGSLNGTKVNGKRQAHAVLATGDKITLGIYTIIIDINPSEEKVSLSTEISLHDDADAKFQQSDILTTPTAQGQKAVSQNTPAPDLPSEKSTETQEPDGTPEAQEQSITFSHDGSLEENVMSASVTQKIVPIMPRANWEREDKENLTLEDKTKSVIIENPLFTEQEIVNELKTDRYGNTKINLRKLRSILKSIDLDTKSKRMFFGV